MGRRSDHSREELIELALSAASSIVTAEGPAALTARRVAGAIGYAPGTLYNLFENLDGLILRLNGLTLDRLSQTLRGATATGRPADDLNRLLDLYLGFVDANPKLWSLLFEHRLPDGQDLPVWYHEKVQQILETVEHALAPLFESSQDEDKAETARLIWAGVHGILSLAGSGKLQVVSARPPADMARHLVSHVVAGVAARQQATPTRP